MSTLDPLELTAALTVGVRQIDDQHRELFGHINGLFTALRGGSDMPDLVRLFEYLEQYTHFHFGDEESYMDQRRLFVRDAVQYKEHMAQHQAFMRDMKAFREDFELMRKPEILINEFAPWIRNWYLNHIARLDSELAKLNKQ